MASSFSDTFEKITKNVKEKTQNLTEKQELLQTVRANEKQQAQLFSELGRAFFAAHAGEAEGEFHAEVAALRQLKAENASAQEKIALLSGACVCAACKAAIPAESKFCPVCGTAIVKAAPEAPAAEADAPICPVCGKPVRAEAAFCTACGARLH